MGKKEQVDDIANYTKDQEYIANKYNLRCFTITILILIICFVLNIVGIFIVDNLLMIKTFIGSLAIYSIINIIVRKLTLSNPKTKYLILFGQVGIYTLTGVFITYHVTIMAILPFLYATLYSSKKVMTYVYSLTIISTAIVVYGGYFFGLCDANMALLTTTSLPNYVVDGQFTLTAINPNPYISLLLYYIVPRWLIYIVFAFICNKIFSIVNGSLERARLTNELEIAKEQAENAKEQAENANKAKSQFLAKMSHEIRTPINAILGMNEMILRESNEHNIKVYSNDVKSSSVLLLSIVDDILDSSKIESGMMEIVPVNYHICSLLNDLYNIINLKASEKKLKLIFKIDPSIPSQYYGDDKRIRQIILNILTNAVKYTNEGTITLSLRHEVDGDEATLFYSVKDTGIGIREEDIDKIYDAFKRFDMLRNRNVQGTGLGMNITQQLLKLMGSELQITSEYEKGSEFSFELKQKIVDQKPLGDFYKRFTETEEKGASTTNYVAPNAKVLVVDDQELNLKVFRHLLKQTQIQISEGKNGLECLEQLKNNTFDIVFLDHMMPVMDGMETLKEIKSQDLCPNIPIIMLTANAIIGDREKYLDTGFDDFISKPIIPDKLNNMLLKYLPKDKVEF